jgi:DNA-directed RNA polymerase specialized sigma24 family protein
MAIERDLVTGLLLSDSESLPRVCVSLGVRDSAETCRGDMFRAGLALSCVMLRIAAVGVSGGNILAAWPPSHPMGDQPIGRERRITSRGLTRLLSRLGADDDRAAAEYERLRQTLERFFDWRGAWPPEECADETLDRLARRLEEDVEVGDVWAYARGIARLVLLERQRRPSARSIGECFDLPDPSAPTHDANDPLLTCFDRCLEALPAESRTAVLDYYGAERREKIETRRRLAIRFGVSDSALRNRIQRIRDRLERCVMACMGGTEGRTDGA